MKTNQIIVGDEVSVEFINRGTTLCTKAIVEHIPLCVGDFWVFTDTHNDNIYYVSEPCTITKRG